MKKVMLVGVMMMFAFMGKTQVVVNEVNINELEIKFVELVGRAKLNPT